jgi:hypothetical protein
VLFLILLNEAGEVLKKGHAMRTGEAHWDGETLWLDWGDAVAPYAVDPECLDDIKPVSSEVVADETGADFYLVLYLPPLPEGGEKSGEYRDLGWKLPDPPASQ